MDWAVADDFSDSPPETFDQTNGSDDGTYVDIDTFDATFLPALAPAGPFVVCACDAILRAQCPQD